MKFKRCLFCYCFVICLLSSGVVLAQSTAGAVSGSAEGTTKLLHAPDMSTMSAYEQKWYRIFQEGSLLFDGWKRITKEILSYTPEELRERQKVRLEQLGLKIGLEWCKTNDVRRVDNKMLLQWGSELKKVARKDPRQLPDVIASIDQEVSSILN